MLPQPLRQTNNKVNRWTCDALERGGMVGGGDDSGRHRHHRPHRASEVLRPPGPGASQGGREDPGQEVLPPVLCSGLRHPTAAKTQAHPYQKIPALPQNMVGIEIRYDITQSN